MDQIFDLHKYTKTKAQNKQRGLKLKLNNNI